MLLGAVIAGAALFANAWYVGDFSEVVPGKLYRSRQPRGMQWSVLDRHHIAGVIDLRLPSETPPDFAQEQQACKDRNVAFVSIPIGDLLPDDDQFRAFLRAVRAGNGPFLVHCEHGRNRTGHVIAAYRIVVQNWTPQQAWDELRRHDAEPQDPVKHQLLDAILIRLDRDRAQWFAATDPNGK